MKKVFLFAAIAALFAACSSKDELVKDDSTQQPQLEKGTIGFDVYTQKATTRAGWTGSVTTADLKEQTDNTDKLGYYGFGVFGYYTDNNEYEQRSVPNFMYNQQVKWDGSNFSYNPVVYWPNEYGSNATSDDQDKLTFFAYAPYVKVIPSSGKIDGAALDKALEQWGITGMTKNTTQGDPILKYIGSFDNKKSVDLCWGVADNGDGAAWNIVQTGNPQTEIKNGMPWIDLERPAGVDQRVRFTFKHATAQMRVSIDADIDVDGRGETKPLTKKTRIWVRQVTFKGFTMKGSLNLNNDDPSIPKWLDYNGQNELVAEDVVIYDGRKDGKEGVAGAVATNEKSLGLNPALIQDGVYAPGEGSDSKKGIYDEKKDVIVYGVDATGNQKSSDAWARPGVTNTTVNLFKYNNTDNTSQASVMTTGEFFHVIPVNDNFEVEIVYDVETVDQNLAQSLSDGAAKGSSIENRISKTITFGDAANNKLLPGHSYTLALHLGMNSVKFDAAVSEWIDEAAQDVDLPLNTPVFPAGTPASVTIPYTGSYTFALTGLHGQETMTATAGVNTINKGATTGNQEQSAGFISMPSAWTATANNAWTNGTALQTLEAKTNPNTTNQIQKVTWTGSQSGITTEMTFTQKAHPLYLAITAAAGNTITLTRYNDVDHSDVNDWKYKYGWLCGTDGVALTSSTAGDPEAATPANGIAVYRNGSKLTFAQSASPTAKQFDFTDTGVPTGGGTAVESTAVITIGDVLKPGDVIKVVLKTGDAPVETVTAVYEGMYFSPASATIKYGQSFDMSTQTLKNASGAITYVSKNTDIATVSGSTITTVKPGTATIEATDAAGSKAEFTLTVAKQNTEIKLTTPDVNPKAITTGSRAIGTPIITFDASIKGEITASPGGTVTYEFINAIRVSTSEDKSLYFQIDPSDNKTLKIKEASIGKDVEYKIRVKAKGAFTGDDAALYNNPDDLIIEIHYTPNAD